MFSLVIGGSIVAYSAWGAQRYDCSVGVGFFSRGDGLGTRIASHGSPLDKVACEDHPDNNPGDPIMVPLTPREFSEAIGKNSPEDIGVPLLNNIPDDVLERIIGSSPQAGTGSFGESPSSRQSPESAISPTSSRSPVSVPTVDPSTGETTATTEWPAFCTWATIVCEFIDWMTESPPSPPEEQIPTEEVGSLETYNSGLGGGSCPAGVNFSINGNAVNYSFQPACDAMIWFKPILLAMSTLIAGYILVGHKQG